MPHPSGRIAWLKSSTCWSDSNPEPDIRTSRIPETLSEHRARDRHGGRAREPDAARGESRGTARATDERRRDAASARHAGLRSVRLARLRERPYGPPGRGVLRARRLRRRTRTARSSRRWKSIRFVIAVAGAVLALQVFIPKVPPTCSTDTARSRPYRVMRSDRFFGCEHVGNPDGCPPSVAFAVMCPPRPRRAPRRAALSIAAT